MKNRRRYLHLTLLAVAALAIPGCTGAIGADLGSGSPAPLAASPPSGSPSGSDVLAPVAVAVARTLPNTMVTLAPPASATPNVSSEAAYALCLNGVAACGAGLPSGTELASVTDLAWGGTSSTGSPNPGLHGVLAWVMTWTGQVCPVFGGLGPRPSGALSRGPCTRTAIVDAKTGAFIYAVDY